MAGVSRLQYTTESKLIRVMCSGRVDLAFVLRAFSKGADGVFIGGCKLNECNYITHGNFDALNMVLLCKRIMEHIGLHPDRLRIAFMSGSDANTYVESVNAFVDRIKELGPLGRGEGLEGSALKIKLAEVTRLVPYIKLAMKEKLATRLKSEAEYDRLFTIEEVGALLRDVVSYYIDPDKCQACTLCAQRCPVDAITGGKNLIHVIDQDKCIKCGMCFETCPARFGAVTKISGKPVPPPLPEEKRTLQRKTKE